MHQLWFADSNALEKLDSELIRLGTNSVENNLECTSPEKAAKKDWSKIYYKFLATTCDTK